MGLLRLIVLVISLLLAIPAVDAQTNLEVQYTPYATKMVDRTAQVYVVYFGQPIPIGSGWAYKDRGQLKVVTAQHVALSGFESLLFCASNKPGSCITVYPTDGVGPVLGFDIDKDWVEFEVDKLPKGLKPSKLAKNPMIGEDIYCLGNPLGDHNGEITKGIITNYEHGVFIGDCRLLPGNSGGPVYNEEGHIVGMAVAAEVVEGHPVWDAAMILPASHIIHKRSFIDWFL